jgi:hypothetical protein
VEQKVELMTTLMRYCFAVGTTIILDSDGYLPDPADTFGHAMNPGLITLSELAQYPNVALLEEPGSGKTTALRHIADLLREHSTGLALVEVDLLEVTDRAAFDELVVRPVRARLPSAADRADEVSRPEARVADSDDALNVSVAKYFGVQLADLFAELDHLGEQEQITILFAQAVAVDQPTRLAVGAVTDLPDR